MKQKQLLVQQSILSVNIIGGIAGMTLGSAFIRLLLRALPELSRRKGRIEHTKSLYFTLYIFKLKVRFKRQTLFFLKVADRT